MNALVATGLAAASSAIVVTAPDRLIAPAVEGLPLIEPHVAVSPSDPNHLVAGSIVAAATVDGPWYCATFVSRDRGETWSRHDLNIDRCIDPWALILPDGAALIVAIEIRRDVQGDERFRLLAYRSEDGGQIWPEEPRIVGSAYEHPILAVHEGKVYLASRRMRRAPDGSPRHTIGVERSIDGGRYFEPVAEIRPSNLALNATGLSVDGERMIVTFVDFQRNVDGFDQEGVLEHPRAWALVSTDGGVRFSAPKFLSEACGMKGGFPGYPISASGADADRIVFACVRPGFDGVVRHVSADGGATWSEPLRIDGDSPHVRTPMLAVNAEGIVAAAWHDRRFDPERACQNLYAAASVDDGVSFLEPVRLSTEDSCPAAGDNGRVAESWPMGGDYSSLTAGPDGAFHVVWADSRSGRFQLHMATFAVQTE